MRKTLSAANLAATAAPLALLIQTAAAQEAVEAVELPEIVVGGGLTPVDGASYARAATIITEEEIARRNARSFADVLRQTPGVSVSRVGGPAGETAVRIRGSESNHVLVLIDGVPAPQGAAGFDFSFLTPDQIERVEVLRGPQSAIYGAGATAGVINIITKGGLRGETRATVTAEGSSAPGGRGGLLLQGGTDTADIGFGISYVDDEGWDPSGDDGEKDGLRNLTLNLRGSADLAEDVSVRGNLRFTDREGEFEDTDFGCGDSDCYVVDTKGRVTEGQDLFAGVTVDVRTLGGALVHSPSLSFSSSDTRTVASFGPSENDVSSFDAAYQAAYTFGPLDRHTIVGAVQYKRETFTNSFAGDDEKARQQVGYVLDYRGRLTDALFVQGGVRYDDNEDFDDFLAWSASASYSFAEFGTRIRGSVGRAQTNPDFFELFGFVPGEFVGNPNLKPERNFGWDVGVDQSFWSDRGLLSVTYFNETLEDEITGFGNTVDNLDGESDRQGVELALSVAPVEGLTLGLNYTYLDATEPDGSREVRRPEHSIGASAFYRFLADRATVGLDLTYVGEAKDRNFGDPSFTSPKTTLDDYLLVNVTGSYRLTGTVEMYGGVRNLFDAEYEDVLGYRQEPLTGFLGLRATF